MIHLTYHRTVQLSGQNAWTRGLIRSYAVRILHVTNAGCGTERVKELRKHVRRLICRFSIWKLNANFQFAENVPKSLYMKVVYIRLMTAIHRKLINDITTAHTDPEVRSTPFST